jgi:aminoglycoside phosphotransferase (APT) family kinase protein
MKYQPIDRDEHSYQRPLSGSQIQAMCERLLGPSVHVVEVIENPLGTYNSTFRVELSESPPVYLRVASEPGLQFRSEHRFMRNEHAGIPFLAPIAQLLSRTLGVDFTHEIVDRDYLIQSQLEGVPAPEGLDRFPRAERTSFFRDMGSIARTIHNVRGEGFEFIAGPTFDSWSAALLFSLDDIAADHDDVGLPSEDVRTLSDCIRRHRSVFDAIAEPRLLHGDLWTVNVTIAAEAHEPRIVGVCDCDRMSWGDPRADWPIFMARKRSGTERDSFWDTYGRDDPTPDDEMRTLIYEARHIVMARLERYRLGKSDEIDVSYRDTAQMLGKIPG